YVAAGGDGLYVVAANDPANMILISQIHLPGYVQSLACGEDHLYVAAGSGGLRILDIANPALPYPTGWFVTAYARGLAVDWRDVILADGFDGVRLLRNDLIVPVMLADFAAVWRDGRAELSWRLHGDADLAGGRLLRERGGGWETVARIDPASGVPVTWVDAGAPRGGAWYRLVITGRDGRESLLGETRLAAAPPTPLWLSVAPNPFNPRTDVSFVLDRPGLVSLNVHDAAGRLVRTLHDAPLPAGPHTLAWDGRDETGRRLPSAPYYVRLVSADRAQTRPVMLLK
ncbi:hypothetical protein H8E07_16045, partial [bacterium]|nr:hypothetical protein [bacterium]